MNGSIKRSGSADEQVTSQVPVLEIDRPRSTTWMRFSLVPGFPKSDPQSLVLRLPEGSKGNYSVTLILGTPGKGFFNDLLQLGTLASTGDSLLEIGKGIEVDFTVTSGEVEALVTAVANSDGQMASLKFRVNAKNFDDAIRFSYDLIAPSLSWWSYWYDVPLDVKGYEAIEESTGTRQYLVGVLGCAKGFDPSIGFCKFGEEFRSVLAIYREAINTTNFFYKVLSFYKVAEGVRVLIGERRTKALERSETWREPTLRMPETLSDLELDEARAFAPYVGKKFTSVLDHFRTLIRNAVAHLDPTGNALDGDRFKDIAACEEAEPVLKHIARTMIRAELAARGVKTGAE